MNIYQRAKQFILKGPGKTPLPYAPTHAHTPASFGAQVFWPYWPSQENAVSLVPPSLTESSLVMAAVNWAGTVFSEPTLQVLAQNARTNDWLPVDNHPLVNLWEQPNPYYSGATMLKAFAYYWLASGNVYLYKRRDEAGRLRELWLIDSDRVTPRWPADGSEFISHYEVRTDGTPYVVARNDLIHFRYGLDPDNHRLGLSPMKALIDELVADESALYYTRNALAKFGIPPFFLWPKANADSVYQLDTASMQTQLKYATTGANAGSGAIFSSPMELATVGFNPSQMGLKETHSLPEERVCAVLGIPALVLGFGFDDHATYSNYKTALQAAWQNFVIPTLKLFATELTNQLLPEYDSRRGEWVEFDTNEIWALEPDQNAIATREVEKWRAGLVTQNEARAAMGMDALPGGDQLIESDSEVESKQLSLAQHDELRAWFRKFGPKDAQGILDAEMTE